MKTYTARCEWDETGVWAVRVPEVPGAFTQCKRLDQVVENVAEAIELMTGETPDQYELAIDWHVYDEAGTVAIEARALRRRAAEASAQAERHTAEAARRLHDAGFSYRDIGAMVGVSHQRAHQLVSS